MTPWFVFLWMVFMHVFDDYVLQGVLSSMKQKDWWAKNAPDKMYKNDYKAALICHAVSWTFCVMLPLAVYCPSAVGPYFCAVFAFNVAIHAVVDNEKANKHKISLWQDQAMHLVQIVATFAMLFLAGVM